MLTLARYSELALKSKQTRKRFEEKLVDNIKSGLKGKYQVKRIYGRIIIDNFDKKVKAVLPRVFGIVSFSPCWKTSSDLNNIEKTVFENIKIRKTETFAVVCNRTGKHSYTSKHVEEKIGAKAVEKFKCKVKLKNPKKIIGIDIRDKDAFIYTDVFKGPGGLPLGTAYGKVLALIENLDSVAATWMIMKRGCGIIFVGSEKHFKVLEKWAIGSKLEKHNLGTEKEIKKIIEKEKCLAIVIGDSKLEKINRFQKFGIPVFMPLIGMDNKEIKITKNKIK